MGWGRTAGGGGEGGVGSASGVCFGFFFCSFFCDLLTCSTRFESLAFVFVLLPWCSRWDSSVPCCGLLVAPSPLPA
ncbi:hypothetical protein BU14_1769s0001 [Porphyra umbilicalis]|uniref:Uncharacterized protein n=1 Tax=Porphyra umbilicalis TaxID=2786 RepID=A0A1X6NKM0_PORUM|nr:hypothetical protein BU14_1769s0001 [Porphyra umbilicalis]|eukprot:OSX69179.1 hypothetical protein BU14_1769s0001 [Porphyra umbilicalis]